jgi:hypothetical protein
VRGIASATARIETDGLKIVRDSCPRLLHEAELYRSTDAPADSRAEAPVDEHNHALAALRYLISRLAPWRGCGEGGYGLDSACAATTRSRPAFFRRLTS